MIGKPKQQRSLNRINRILQAAESILEHESIDALTIAKISEVANLKRTSTYKFFETPDDIKLGLIQVYIERCNEDLLSNFQIDPKADYAMCLKDSVTIMIKFFKTSQGAQKLILEHNISPTILSNELHKIAQSILKPVENSVGLTNMFNKPGVFLVITQIIFSILSFNTKENGELTDVGLNEAVRATNAYLLSCIAAPA